MADIGHLLEAELPTLRRYARALTRDAGRAEDLVQSCLVRALSRQHQWQEGSDLRAWLCTILHNEFVSELRRHARERERLPAMEISPAMLPGSDPELSLRLRELQNALGKLPAWQREMVLQVGIECMTYDDAAAALGIPIGTVRSRMARARENLRVLTDHPPSRQAEHRRAAA